MRRLALVLLLLAAATPAGAQQLLESYEAWIGPDDVVNSRGARLTEAWQVIRQDRANFHRFGIRDPGDTGDRFFALPENRETLEAMLAAGRIDPRAAREIVRGGVTIRVDIWGRGTRAQWIDVTLY